jgi:aspartyl-tRNA(Asn)/glutamyl-tRNA(Gln) amidotransferase subunit C
MAELDRKAIEKLIELSRIQSSEEEKQALLESLKKILAYVEQLQEVDTEGVPACNHVIPGMTSPMREDVVGATLERDEFLKNSPAHVGGMIRVPPVFKKG